MRYMVAHMLRGEAKEYHMKLSNVLATAYHLRPVTNLIDPHLTVKSAFEAADISEVEQIVNETALFAEKTSYTLKGFGTVESRLIYMNVEAPKETHVLIQKLQNQLLKIPWLEFRPHEIPAILHATLCFPKSKAQSDDMFERLTKANAPSFECAFDNIAILKRGDRRWEVVREFEVG